MARSARVEDSDKTFFLFVTISKPGFSSEPLLVLPLASAAIVWPINWLSEIAKASGAFAELLLSAEKPSDATIANKKIRKAIVMMACFKIYIPPYRLRYHYHISNYLSTSKTSISEQPQKLDPLSAHSFQDFMPLFNSPDVFDFQREDK